jgi:multidrug efflux system outer membrane protein
VRFDLLREEAAGGREGGDGALNEKRSEFDMRKLNIVVGLAAVLAAGCEVGPDYHPPQITVRPAFAETASTQPAAAAPAPDQKWWENFHDPELNSLIARAEKGNLNLQSTQSHLLQARAQRGVVGADLWPQINADGGYQNGRGSKNVVIPSGAFGFSGFGSPAATPTVRPAVVSATTPIPAAPTQSASVSGSSIPLSPLGQGGLPGVETQLYQGGFDASWELDVFGGQRRSIEAADADIGASLEDEHDMLLSLEAEVARDYIELRSNQWQLQIADDNLHAQQETLELTRSRYRAGFVTQLDVARESAQVASTAATLPVFEQNVRTSIHELGILLGEDPDALSQELSAAGAMPPVPAQIPLGVPAELLRRRPDIRRAERQLAAATARIGEATADLYPKFNITGELGIDSSKINTLVEWNSRYFGINPGVSWDIFDAGKIRSNINVQKELTRQAALNYQQTVLVALGEVEDALSSYRLEQLRRKALADAVDASEQSVELAKQQYEQGVIDFESVLDAQRSLFEAQTVLAQSDELISTDIVALYKALGGGWEVASAEK